MKQQRYVYLFFIIQGIISLLFSIALFFFLPHQFSQAVAHYVKLAPIIRNYYCATLLGMGLISIYLFIHIFVRKNHRLFKTTLLMIGGVNLLFGLLIYPLVDFFYQIQSGIIQENLPFYRDALMCFSLYLGFHIVLAVLSGYDLVVKNPTKKHTLKLCIALALIGVPSCVVSYQKYYEKEEMNLTENLKYQFVGVNGGGSLQIISNDHRLSDYFPSFMGGLTYDVRDNGKLSNGQQVAITVQYDPQLAKDLYLDVVDSVETVEVSGLREFYPNYGAIPSKIVEEAKGQAENYVYAQLSDILPGKETQIAQVAQYYVYNQEQTMDSVHALVFLYRVSYVHQETQYYYYWACHVNHVHSDVLKDLELLEPIISSDTYTSSLCEAGKEDMEIIEAKAHLNAALLNQYDVVEEVSDIEN